MPHRSEILFKDCFQFPHRAGEPAPEFDGFWIRERAHGFGRGLFIAFCQRFFWVRLAGLMKKLIDLFDPQDGLFDCVQRLSFADFSQGNLLELAAFEQLASSWALGIDGAL